MYPTTVKSLHRWLKIEKSKQLTFISIYGSHTIIKNRYEIIVHVYNDFILNFGFSNQSWHLRIHNNDCDTKEF